MDTGKETIEVRFFARLREALGVERLTVPAAGISTLEDVLEAVRAQVGERSRALGDGPVLAAVNQEMAPLSSAVRVGDEVAFFPPVTGG